MNSLTKEQITRLCQIQADIFVRSLSIDISSVDYIRSYLLDSYVAYFDKPSYFYDNIDRLEIENHIQPRKRRKTIEKFSEGELHWIGYLLRYFAIREHVSSRQIAKLIDIERLHSCYEVFHSQSMDGALDMVLDEFDIQIPSIHHVSRDTK